MHRAVATTDVVVASLMRLVAQPLPAAVEYLAQRELASASNGRTSSASVRFVRPPALAHETLPERRLAAFAVGWETQLRLVAALERSGVAAGWNLDCVAGVVSAAATACLGAADGEDVLRRALGIAGAQMMGRRSSEASFAALCVERAVENGRLAFLLAREGFTAPAAILDADRGYIGVLASAPDVSSLRDDWGAKWYVAE